MAADDATIPTSPSADDLIAIEIMLKEYDWLRQEILVRIRARFDILGFLVAAAAFVLSRDSMTSTARIAGSLIVIGFGLVVWFWFGSAVSTLGNRNRCIERDVNGILGRSVMQWESHRDITVLHRYGILPPSKPVDALRTEAAARATAVIDALGKEPVDLSRQDLRVVLNSVISHEPAVATEVPEPYA